MTVIGVGILVFIMMRPFPLYRGQPVRTPADCVGSFHPVFNGQNIAHPLRLGCNRDTLQKLRLNLTGMQQGWNDTIFQDDTMAGADQDDPTDLFQSWLNEAHETEPNDPTAMTLATVDAGGLPSARMVLLKGADARGFVFYTNTESQKGIELDATRQAALVFHWKSLRRQVRIVGSTQRVDDAEADAYFASRARGSKIGAWASDQSRPLEGRFELEKRVARFAAKFGTGNVPRPPHWTGYRVVPREMEFWQDKPFRLHERVVYRRKEGGSWETGRIFP